MPRWLIRILSLLTRAWDHFFAPPRPPIVYLDGDGVGWRKRPEWQDASSPDEGQHDWAKRQMRIFLWRAHQHLQREATTDVCIESGVESIDMRVLGLGDRRETAPQLGSLRSLWLLATVWIWISAPCSASTRDTRRRSRARLNDGRMRTMPPRRTGTRRAWATPTRPTLPSTPSPP